VEQAWLSPRPQKRNVPEKPPRLLSLSLNSLPPDCRVGVLDLFASVACSANSSTAMRGVVREWPNRQTAANPGDPLRRLLADAAERVERDPVSTPPSPPSGHVDREAAAPGETGDEQAGRGEGQPSKPGLAPGDGLSRANAAEGAGPVDATGMPGPL